MNACANTNESPGIVTRLESGYAWVELAPSAGCGQCTGACGSGLFGLRAQRRQVRVTNASGAKAGDRVTITVAGGSVLKGAMLAYVMPLALGIAGAAGATMLGGGDGAAAAGLFGGLVAGGLLLRQLRDRREPAAALSLQPEAGTDRNSMNEERQQ